MDAIVCLFESAMEEQIYFKESEIALGLLEHRNLSLISAYEQAIFEDGGSASDKQKGIVNHILDKILEVLDKIKRAIQGFFDAIKSGSKNRLTSDKYMMSDTAEVRLDRDIQAMCRDIDKEYLELRKYVQKISNLSGIPAEEVAKITDNLNEKLHDNRYKIANGAKAVVRGSVIAATGEHIASQLESVQKDQETVRKCIETMKKRRDAYDSKDLTILQHISNALGKINDGYIKTYNGVDKARRYIKKGAGKAINKGNKK